MKVAIIGGTGDLGLGLGLRWARAGQTVVVGSRRAERAEEAARQINAATGTHNATGLENSEAAAAGDVVVLALPWAAHAATLAGISAAARSKIVVDATVPMAEGDPTRPGLAEGSVAEEVQKALGAECRVVGGFHHISARLLAELERPVEADVLICGDDRAAKEQVQALAELLGTRCFDAGPLHVAGILEKLTPLIISLNKRYKRRHIGFKLTGV